VTDETLTHAAVSGDDSGTRRSLINRTRGLHDHPVVERLRGSGIFLALIVLMIGGTLLSENFFTSNNLFNVARNASMAAAVGIGMTFVILTAGIDLSVGSIVGVVAVASATMLSEGVHWTVVIPVGIAVGAFTGGINGLIITKCRVQPFIMTLCMLVVARGVAMTYTEGTQIPLKEHADAFAWLGQGKFLGLPNPTWVLIVMAATAGFVLHYTPFGRHVYAVGDNIEAARLSGIKTNRVLFLVYVISGACSGMAALMYVSRIASGVPLQGQQLELDAIAMVVIGGTSLFGGEGGVRGTLIGAAIVAIVNNLMNLLGVNPYSQGIVLGLIILGAVLIGRRGTRAEGG
jgi:ribose transport system permease protein